MAWALDEGNLELLRGRQGRQGLRGMTLSTFLDICWQEIYDDSAPMGDRHQYRDIVKKLYLEGLDPYFIWYEDGQGKRHRLAKSPAGSKVEKRGLDALRDLREQAMQLAAEARARRDE